MVINEGNNHVVDTEEELSVEEALEEEVQKLTEEMLSRETKYNENVQKLVLENEMLKSQLNIFKFTINCFKHDSDSFMFYTGLPNYQVFNALLNYLRPGAEKLFYWRSGSHENKINERKQKDWSSADIEY